VPVLVLVPRSKRGLPRRSRAHACRARGGPEALQSAFAANPPFGTPLDHSSNEHVGPKDLGRMVCALRSGAARNDAVESKLGESARISPASFATAFGSQQ
jgi:hypothetical protein